MAEQPSMDIKSVFKEDLVTLVLVPRGIHAEAAFGNTVDRLADETGVKIREMGITRRDGEDTYFLKVANYLEAEAFMRYVNQGLSFKAEPYDSLEPLGLAGLEPIRRLDLNS